MADRLVVDLTENGQVSVSSWREGELTPSPVGEPHTIQQPLDKAALEDLRWYVEDYLRVPYGVYEERGPQVAGQIRGWGQALFEALFAPQQAHMAYAGLRAREDTELLVRSMSPEWLSLPWELVWDPDRPAPLALEFAGVSRMLPSATAPQARAASGKRLRVLMVIARPQGLEDVGYRMVARPLLERLEAVRGQVDLEVLRPPTFEVFQRTVREAANAGEPYQIVHFDGHGVLAGRRRGGGLGGPLQYGVDPTAGLLLFEAEGGGEDRVSAAAFARVVREGGVPVVVLNACQSGALGEQTEAAIATRLLQDGAASVVAMGYSVYVVAAAEFMAAFYEALFASDSIGAAVTAGRQRMFDRQERPSPKGPMRLQDWMVPVHYLQRDLRFPDLQATSKVRRQRLSLDAVLDKMRDRPSGEDGRGDVLAPVGRFVGRDDVFYRLELATRLQRVVVVHGPGGTGKTELAKAFGRWLRDTGGLDHPNGVIFHSFEPGVATFGLDGVVNAVGLQLFGSEFAQLSAEDRRAAVMGALRDYRLLLIWDNFESVHTMTDPGQATPPLDEYGRNQLRGFLAELARPGGKSAVIVTSRTQEPWLGEVRRIPLSGLRPEDAAEYAEDLLQPYPSGRARRADRAFADLLAWLDGHPLAMRIMLPQLEHTPPERLLAALKGQTSLPEGFDPGAGRTASLAASVQYSLNHLDEGTRQMLPAVALFEGVADVDVLAILSRDEHAPARFRGVGREQWAATLDAAAAVGLLTGLGAGMYRVHPALPALLSAAWRNFDSKDYPEELLAAQRALISAYAALGGWLLEQIKQGDAGNAFAIIGLQRRSLGTVLAQALDEQRYRQAQSIAEPLSDYWDNRGLTQEALAWVDRCRTRLEAADGTPPALDTPAGGLWLFMVGYSALLQSQARDLDSAQATYEEILTSLEAQPESEQRNYRLGITYHELGGVAQRRGDLDSAERWYRQALTLEEQLGDRPGMATTHHQLGTLAQDRGDLDSAEAWYRQALTISEQLGDRHVIASTYHQLGIVAQDRGDLDSAEAWCRQALTLEEQLGDRHAIAQTYHQLGRVARRRGDLDSAEGWYRQALTIKERLGDRHAIAQTYHQLGIVAQDRGDLDSAEAWYRQALTISEQLGDRPGMAMSYGQLGLLAEARGQLTVGLEYTVRCVVLFDQFPHPSTGPGPRHLVRLTRQLGIETLEETWRKVTGVELPRAVKDYVKQGLKNEQ
jgi:tetratricopeptide (TPR) repeat protein